MNVWRRGSLTQNPYARTAFRVARVPREVVRHRTVVELIVQTRQLVGADPKAHTIGGRPVDLAEINAAEQVLLDPRKRILEELLEHATERPPLQRVRKLAREAAEAMASDGGGRLAVTNLSGLEPWVGRLVRQFLDGLPAPDPSFGALEMDVPPPFGDPAEE